MVERLRKNFDNCVENIERFFASDTEFEDSRLKYSSRDRDSCVSEPAIGYSVNYDDLCGPWRFPVNPLNATNDLSLKPRLCVWTFLTMDDMNFMKNCYDDETTIKRLIEKRLMSEKESIGTRKNIFLELAWSVIKFSRDNSFTEECISAIVGIFHLAYTYFLSNSWRTSGETYDFFYKTLLLHTVEVRRRFRTHRSST